MTFELPTNTANFTGLLAWSNTVTNNLFGSVIVIVFFAVVFLSLKNFSTERALGAASFTTMIMAFLFRWLGLIGYPIFFLFILLTAIVLIWLVTSGEREEG